MREIMLVDDDQDIRTIAELSLSAVGGWGVVAVSSGAEALERLQSCSPDLILLDVMMPGMDGPETLRRIREHESWASIPVIFMTAKVQKHEVDQYLSLGATGVLAKPFDPMSLPRDIESVLTAARVA